jgi:ABC-type lipoprotein release transport system permease subunit
MLVFKIAFRNLLRRKSRMLAIGILVLLGTLLIILGDTFSISAKYYGRASIVEYFTGDLVLYSSKSKEKPTPFAFTTPLPLIQDIKSVLDYLKTYGLVKQYVALSQNYSLISIDDKGQKSELPFIFYAIDPAQYNSTFDNLKIISGSFFGIADGDKSQTAVTKPGILLTRAQTDVFAKNYNTTLSAGDSVTVLGLTEGGSVNAIKTTIAGIVEPIHYKNVFDYINFIDMDTYSRLYNFTGVKSSSLPDSLNKAFALDDEASIFALGADSGFGKIDTATLSSEEISGYTMISVKLKDRDTLDQAMTEIVKSNPTVLASRWDEASGGFAAISSGFQAFIYIATLLIFLIVSLIFMNTLIINVIERTAEIGTMRAIGSRKSLIRKIFLAETFILNIFFAFIGIVIGAIILILVSKDGIPLPDTISQYLIGGGNLQVQISIVPFIEALAIICIVSVLATLYPIRVATRVTPLKAMSEK